MASYTVNWNDIIDMSFHQTKPICQFKWCLIAILLLGCSIFPESLFALPDAEVQELVRSDPIFAYAEKTLLNTWAVTPKSIKRTIRNEQMAWIKTKRDQEAAELMGQGFSFSQAYAISTAVRNNYIYMIIPSSERYKATYLNIDALIQQYNAAYTPQPKPPVYNYNTTNRANTNRHSPLDKAFTSAISWLGLCFVWFGGMVVVGLVRSLIRAADKKFFIFKGPAKPHMESKPAAANEESQKAAEQAEAAERQRQFERENAEREARERLEQEAKNRAEEEARRKAERKETLKVAPKRDPHKVLGVSASDSLEEIRKAYRELSKKYHPDRVHDLGVEFQEMADKKFKEITLAWDEIKKRRQGL